VQRETWAVPAACVLAVGSTLKLLYAVLLPETRPATLVGGIGLVVLAVALAGYALLRRRGHPRTLTSAADGRSSS
jgi:hypothetical protein